MREPITALYKIMELRDCGVEFNEELHEYYLFGERLTGITGIIGKRLFPQKYSGIPDVVLAKAAERGTAIHKQCELIDTMPIESKWQEVINYKRLMEDNNLAVEKSEYLVTDYTRIASAIDKVFRLSDDEFMLGDIKTTYRFDKKSLQWQLSIYAWLFEMNNPGAKVSKLYGIWLKNEKAKLAGVERIPVQTVEALIDFHFANIDNDNIFNIEDYGNI